MAEDKDKPQKVRILSDCIMDTERLGLEGRVYEVPGPIARLLISYGKAEFADEDDEISPEAAVELADDPGTVQNRDPVPAGRGGKRKR